MDYFTTTAAATRRASGCIIVGLYRERTPGLATHDIDQASDGLITKLARQGDLSSEPGRCTILRGIPGVRADRVAVVGCGDASAFGVSQYRRALDAAITALKGSKVGEVTNYLALEKMAGADAYYKARYAVETVGNLLYSFTRMKSSDNGEQARIGTFGNAVASRSQAARSQLGGEHALAISAGMALCRDLGNLPANACTPTFLARKAQEMARGHARLETKVLGEKDMKRLKMHSFLSVTNGTIEPAKLIIMNYRGAARQKPVVLVGKGVTFDSGGISLKPGPAMDEMKFDMCGAASVIGTMEAIARLQPEINLTVVVPACENLPSGSATKPGDIVTSMAGKTIEVLNTDAEGRLILCDALTYARRFKPSLIIDVATLTGACVVALGHHRTAVMSRDDDLARQIKDAGDAADDKAWPLPMAEEYERQLRSNFADFANVGGRDGGAITAACFLGKFTEDMPWAHLDIAGTAWKSGSAKGATGRPVPLLAQLVLGRARALP